MATVNYIANSKPGEERSIVPNKSVTSIELEGFQSSGMTTDTTVQAHLNAAIEILAFVHFFLPCGELNNFPMPEAAVEGLRKTLHLAQDHVVQASTTLLMAEDPQS